MKTTNELKIVKFKINSKQFSRYALNDLMESETAKALNDEIMKKLDEDKNIKVSSFVGLIHKYGAKFAKESVSKIPAGVETDKDMARADLYNCFVGDYFEAFAEYFLKGFDGDERFGVRNYEPTLETEDMGVDGYGLCYDDLQGEHACVVQVKYRANPLEEISYSALARTFAQGVCQFNVDPGVQNTVILFGTVGANYNARNVLGNRLYEITDKMIDREIHSRNFWEDFFRLFQTEHVE